MKNSEWKSGGGRASACAKAGVVAEPAVGVMPRQAVVDVQAFRDPRSGSFVFKELCLVDLDSMAQEHHLFKPPKDGPGRHSTDIYLHAKHHGLNFDQGEKEYSRVVHVLHDIKRRYWFVFAKGVEKCDELELAMSHPVYELQYFGCPSLKKLTGGNTIGSDCSYHPSPDYICAKKQAVLLAKWCSTSRELINLTDEEVRMDTFHQWASFENPQALAYAGFVHIRNTKCGLRCVYCGFEILQLKAGCNPQKHHENKFPDCSTFQKKPV